MYFGRLNSEINQFSGFGNQIRVFNKNGMLLNKLNLDKEIFDFCVDEENNKLYCVNYNEENPVFYYDLNKINF